MNRTGHVRLPALARDLLGLVPPEYILYLEQDAVSLMRLGRGSRLETVLTKEIADPPSSREIAAFCENLRETGAYYGQPVSVIVNRPDSYTYARRMNKSDSAGIFERVKLLSQEDASLETRLFRKQADKIFVAQAFDKTLMDALREALDEVGMNVEQIVSLPAAAIRGILSSKGAADSIELYQLPRGKVAYLLRDARGNILFDTMRADMSSGGLEAAAKDLRETFFEPGGDVETRTYSLTGGDGASTNHRPIVAALRGSIRSARRLGTLAVKTRRSRYAAIIRTAVNSARLLLMVLGAAGILSALVAGVTGLAARSDSALIESYQQHYNSKLALEQTRDSLLSVERMIVAERRPTRDLAPIISAFCQRRFSSLALTRVYLSNVSSESTFVEITGSAENEDVIFRYVDAVSPYVAPYSLTMSSMLPDIRSTRGAADTTVTFKLRMIVD